MTGAIQGAMFSLIGIFKVHAGKDERLRKRELKGLLKRGKIKIKLSVIQFSRFQNPNKEYNKKQKQQQKQKNIYGSYVCERLSTFFFYEHCSSADIHELCS